jgi:predicted ester cyclase
MAFYRLAGGKIVEERAQLDMLGALQQLGAVPRT